MALDNAVSVAVEADRADGWKRPGLSEIWQHPLPHLRWFDRTLTRVCSAATLSRFSRIAGLEHIGPQLDPFILALNHATQFEALALPALLIYHRGGKRVHFFADWNFQMIPGIGLLYRRSGAIVVTRKSARPRALNVLKPLYSHALPSMDRAKAHLAGGRSIAIFAEGTVNRDPERLLRGRLGAARLSLETGAAVVPGGISVSGGTQGRPILALSIGAPMRPGLQSADGLIRTASSGDVRHWHSVIMSEIARLSGKSWQATPQEPDDGTR